MLAPPSTSAPDEGTLAGLALPDYDDNAWHAWDYTNSTDPVDAVLADDNHTYAEWSTEGGKKEWERWAPANYDRKCVRIGGKEFNEFIHVYSRDWGNGGGKNCMKGFLDNLGAGRSKSHASHRSSVTWLCSVPFQYLQAPMLYPSPTSPAKVVDLIFVLLRSGAARSPNLFMHPAYPLMKKTPTYWT